MASPFPLFFKKSFQELKKINRKFFSKATHPNIRTTHTHTLTNTQTDTHTHKDICSFIQVIWPFVVMIKRHICSERHMSASAFLIGVTLWNVDSLLTDMFLLQHAVNNSSHPLGSILQLLSIDMSCGIKTPVQILNKMKIQSFFFLNLVRCI